MAQQPNTPSRNIVIQPPPVEAEPAPITVEPVASAGPVAIPAKEEAPPAPPVKEEAAAPVQQLVAMTPQDIIAVVKAATKTDMDTSSIIPLLKDDEGNPCIPISMDAVVTKKHFNPHHGPNDRICQ